MCDLDDTGAPSIFKMIRAAALARIFPILHLSCEEKTTELLNLQKNGEFPDDLEKNKVYKFTV